jgi:glycosyltransferase involved in cell wall biosynthesis
MKALQVVGNSAYGGATYLIVEWCKYLIDKGWHVDILCTDQQTKDKLLSIPNIRVISNIFIPREINLGFDFVAIYKMIALMRKEKYEVVHTYTATPSILGRFTAWVSGVERIYHHQAGWTIDTSSSKMKKIIFALIERIASLMSTKSICVGEGVAQEARKYRLIPESKIKIIHNGIDPSPFINPDLNPSRIRESLSLPKNAIVIGCTSRLSIQKDIISLVQAFALLPNKINGHELFLVIAGEGEERQNIITYALSNHLYNRLVIPGFIEDIPAFLSCIDIYVSPTLREGLSISLLEAMAAAKPIIATNILANREIIINQKTGLLVPIKSPKNIAKSIHFLIDNPNKALLFGKKARNLILGRYTIDRMFKETYELYSDQ